MAARTSSLSTLWHQRYGHLNIQYLSQLSREVLVSGLPDIQTQHLGVCGACQAGKQHRTPFNDGDSWRASKVLHYICGPMNTSSITGCKYFLLIVDDFSRKMWVYFLRQKSDVFSTFQKLNLWLKKSPAIVSFLLEQITVENFVPLLSPTFVLPMASNANSLHLTLLSKIVLLSVAIVRLLRWLVVPNKYWAEAVFTVVYLLNRSPTQAVKGQTLEEVWSGRKPRISHLKIFGSLSYVWIPDTKRSKLDSKS